MRQLGYFLTLAFVPSPWRIPCFALLGVLVGLGFTVARISRATSYLSDDPETCVNCHVMYPQYVTWQHGSHALVATCNDCHVPQDNIFNHYAFKAMDGLWHSTVFTMHWEPQVIRLSPRAIPVVEANCRRCHENVVNNVAIAAHQRSDLRCWDCHRETPHGRVRSLSVMPPVLRPQLPQVGATRQEIEIGGRAPRPVHKENPP